MKINLKVVKWIGASLWTLLWGVVPLAAAGPGPNVVTSIQPLYLLAREVLPAEISVQRLLPPGVSPHGFQMAVSQRQLLEQAQLVVWVGPSLEPFLTAVMKNKPQLQLLQLSAIQWPSQVPLNRVEHRHSDDPHLWLNPENGRAIARQLVAEVTALQPALAAQLQAALQAFEDQLDGRVAAWQARLSPFQDQPWLLFHDSARHFAQYFNLRPYQTIAINPENRPGAKYLHQLRRQLSRGQCLLVEEYYPTRQAQLLAGEFNLTRTSFDPLGTGAASYTELIDNMVGRVQQCMADAAANNLPVLNSEKK